MAYLIFNADEEFLDVLQFESEDDLNAYKLSNPTHTLQEELDDDITLMEDDVYSDDSFEEDEW